MRCCAIPLLLLVCTVSLSLDPPVKLWERQYSFPGHSGGWFRDIEVTPEGNLFITGASTDFSSPDTLGYCAFLIDVDGNVLWTANYTRYSMFGQDGAVLPDGSMVITGYGQGAYGSSRELFIMKIDKDGNTEWTKVYDYPDTKEEGNGITCLPDGGFAVCGRVHGTSIQLGQAWILRTNSQGDTLWTDTWGTKNANFGTDILFNSDELCIAAFGGDDTLTTLGSHLLFYDLDGNYIRGTDYSNLYYHFPRGLCTASDGGYTFVVDLSVIWHTDQQGETLWWHNINSFGNDELHDITRTMDSGYLLCGWAGEWPEPSQETDCIFAPFAETDTGWTQDAWLVKFDEEGNQQWEIKREAQTTHCHYYSAVQLPEGGYMACGTWGGSAYLARYAPETGITEPEHPISLTLSVAPNPCSSLLSISFSQPEAGHASLCVYDLSGRLISTVADGEFPAGSNTVEWAVPWELTSGCYLVRYISDMGSCSESIALIK